MAIDFSPDRWDSARNNYRLWWQGKLTRPLIPVILPNREPTRPKPNAPLLSQSTCADFSASAEALIDRLDYELEKNVYLGDAFPSITMTYFGPVIIAAFLGARLDNSSGQAWFDFPESDKPIEEIHFKYDPDNIWLQRIKDIYRAGMQRWNGEVLMSMTDLSGILDILSIFRPSGQLAIDLIESPEEVNRLISELHDLWHRYFLEFSSLIKTNPPNYVAWCQLITEEPSYILQSDFSYMISTAMFREFVRPEIEASANKIPHCFYHLDGIGQLPHLDDILSINEIAGIQWVPGAGQPGCVCWPEVYKRIFAAGKKAQISTTFSDKNTESLLSLIDKIGVGPGLHVLECLPPDAPPQTEKQIAAILERFN